LPDDVGRRVVFVSSDHEDASATVAALAESLSFAAIELGKIAEGGRLIQARAHGPLSEQQEIVGQFRKSPAILWAFIAPLFDLNI
jgi:predicted dinucleotide-binding enzyme